MRRAKGAQALQNAFAGDRDRMQRMHKIAGRFEGWRPATDVLVPVRGVQSVFVQVDSITKIGAWPIERVCLVHGPSNEGKTAFVHGLGLSFLQRGHYYAFIDAEHTTPVTWLRQLMKGFETHPGFVAMRPSSYEDTVDRVRKFCETIGEAKAKRELAEDTSGLIVVDSIRKLSPKRLLDTLFKEGSAEEGRGAFGRKKKAAGVDGMSGRAAQYKAALNAQWLDELVPLVAQTGTSVVIITRETEDTEADIFSSKDFKIAGGKALIFDSSLVCRIVKVGNVVDGTGKEQKLYGERHAVEIHKTKIGTKDERTPVACFHTSNGKLVPAGFDRARDVIEIGIDAGIVEKSGSWYSHDGERLGQGEHAVVKTLTNDPERLRRIEEDVRRCFPVES